MALHARTHAHTDVLRRLHAARSSSWMHLCHRTPFLRRRSLRTTKKESTLRSGEVREGDGGKEGQWVRAMTHTSSLLQARWFVVRGFLSLFLSLRALPLFLFLLRRSLYVLLCHLLSKCLLSNDVCVCQRELRVCHSEREWERVTINALKTHENPRRAKVNLIFLVFPSVPSSVSS